MKKVMAESTYDNKLRPDYYENNWANMASAFIVETERWNLATEFFPPDKNPAPTTESSSGGHSMHGAAAPANTLRYSGASRTLPPFIRALSAAIRGSNDVTSGLPEIRALEVDAVKASLKADHEKAIELIKKAAELEEQGPPPSGPPSLIKPTHELFGEILLRAGKPAEALAQFKTALLRQPNRARSLLGAARAAAQSGDSTAAGTFYAKLIEQWKQADDDLPELREARSFLTLK
jgi:tetratricopeptide (TPR) repeat protein